MTGNHRLEETYGDMTTECKIVCWLGPKNIKPNFDKCSMIM